MQIQKIPDLGILYDFKIKNQHIVFNGNNFIMARLPSYLPKILREYAGKTIKKTTDEICLEYENKKAKIIVEHIHKLEKGGFFYNYDTDEIHKVDKDLNDTIQKEKLFTNVQLEVSSDCNLFCKYCYADQGTFQNTVPKGFMTTSIASQFIDFYIKKARKETWINMLGGEPLMNPHLKKIVKLFRDAEQRYSKKFHLQITTNGTMLDKAWVDYILENNIKVCVSIDGTKAIHDRLRPGPDGKGSYDRVLKGLKILASKSDKNNIAVRSTCGSQNIDLLPSLYDQLFDEIGDIQLEISPVIVDENSEMALSEKQLREYPEIILKIHKKRYKNQEDQNQWIDKNNANDIMNRNMKVFRCSAGLNQIVVSVHGDIYPCVPFIKLKQMKMGNIYTDFYLPDDFLPMLSKRGIIHRPDCLSCWAKYICSGGCIGMNCLYDKNPHKPGDYLCKIYKATEAGKLLCFAESFFTIKGQQ